MEKQLSEIAALVNGTVSQSDASVSVSNLGNISTASEGDLIFAVDGYIEAAAQSKASAVFPRRHPTKY